MEYGGLLKATRYLLPQASPEKILFALKCERVVKEHMPDILDELQGIAEATHYDMNRLKALALALNAHPGCSVMAISGEHTTDGKPLFARNFDWYESAQKRSALIDAQVPNKLRHISSNDTLIGRYDGINEAGLAIAISYVAGRADKVGVMFPLAVRHVLDTCRTTQEGVAFLESIPHVRATNFLLMDASSTIATVEASPRKVTTTYSENGFGFITNQFQSEAMTAQENPKKRPSDSGQRLLRLKIWASEHAGNISAESVQQVMQRPYPSGMCVNVRRGRRTFGTMWSWVARPGERAIHFADGSPATVRYQTLTF